MAKKSFKLEEKKTSTQEHIITIPKLSKVNSIKSDMGKVEIIKTDGEKLTIKLSGGNHTRKVQTGGSYTPADTKEVTGETSANYDKDGYKGTLEKYVYSGSYTPSDTKYVTNQTSSSYNSGGYTGTLERYLYSGSYTPSDSKDVKEWKHAGSVLEVVENGINLPSTMEYNSNGYKGTLKIDKQGGKNVDHQTYIPYVGTVTRPASDTRVYRYRGDVTRPASDTRVYRYKGKVARPESDTRTYDYFYQYNVEVDYEDNTAPEINIEDKDLGKITDEIKIKYVVSDKDNDLLKIEEKLNGNIIKTYKDVKNGSEKELIINKTTINNLKLKLPWLKPMGFLGTI